MSRRVDEDGPPIEPPLFVERHAGSDQEVVECQLPLRLPYRRGRRWVLIIRSHTATGQVTLAAAPE